MYTITAKKSENRLYVVLSGNFDTEDAKMILVELERRLQDLEPGFDVINDIRHVKFANVSTALQIKKGTGLVEKYGARHIVRVVGKSKYALLLFAKFSNFTKKSKIYHVPTMQDAEAKLASLAPAAELV